MGPAHVGQGLPQLVCGAGVGWPRCSGLQPVGAEGGGEALDGAVVGGDVGLGECLGGEATK